MGETYLCTLRTDLTSTYNIHLLQVDHLFRKENLSHAKENIKVHILTTAHQVRPVELVGAVGQLDNSSRHTTGVIDLLVKGKNLMSRKMWSITIQQQIRDEE